MCSFYAIYLTAGESIPFMEFDASVREIYIRDMKAKCEKHFLAFKLQYRTQKVIVFFFLSLGLSIFSFGY